jgi:hypothetical protein
MGKEVVKGEKRRPSRARRALTGGKHVDNEVETDSQIHTRGHRSAPIRNSLIDGDPPFLRRCTHDPTRK